MNERDLLFRLYWSRIALRVLIAALILAFPTFWALQIRFEWDLRASVFAAVMLQLFVLATAGSVWWYRQHLLKQTPKP